MQMSKFMTIIGAGLLATSLSITAFAQGSNPSAPQPNSTGTGVITPGTTSTGTATDPSMSKGKMNKHKKAKKSAKKDDAK
jgi:hypothetical protein